MAIEKCGFCGSTHETGSGPLKVCPSVPRDVVYFMEPKQVQLEPTEDAMRLPKPYRDAYNAIGYGLRLVDRPFGLSEENLLDIQRDIEVVKKLTRTDSYEHDR